MIGGMRRGGASVVDSVRRGVSGIGRVRRGGAFFLF